MRAKATYVAKSLLRRVFWAPHDLLRRRNDDLVPPRGLSFVGYGDFEQTGREFLSHFTRLGGLRPTDRVLDIGCGIGRMAIPLTAYLQGGSYAGFDVGREMVRWCQRNVTPRHPNFQFAWAPVYNAKYNPFGTVPASEFCFPYPDASFDFVFATSLFTHLPHDEAEHYLVETARVLRPDGRCLLTFFLLTPESRCEIEADRAMLTFHHAIPGGATTSPQRPEEAVALELDELRRMTARAGLHIDEPIHRGAWANGSAAPTFQDLVVARRG